MPEYPPELQNARIAKLYVYGHEVVVIQYLPGNRVEVRFVGSPDTVIVDYSQVTIG